MGFYGKVNYTDRVSFTIDKVYESRSDMDNALSRGEDTVFIGRYVLVNYEGNDIEKNYLRLFAKENENYLYFSSDLDEATRATSNEGDFHVDLNQIVYALDEQQRQTYYICTSYTNSFAIFKKLSESPEGSNKYYSNYQKDYNAYGPGRGYDSTVWQKIYVDGAEKYAMIAELNSVVPTFNLVVDAPSIDPVAPHFDSDSTNVYYKLHMQPQWGFRVKPDDSVYSTKGEAIYYNADGFISNKQSRVDIDDEISLKPTGISEYSATVGYNAHDENNPSKTNKNVKDIQELSIILPSLGNAVSDMWDVIYGYETNGTRTTELGWDKNGTKRLVKEDETGYLFNEGDDIATIAGCINSVHDLMGKIIDNRRGKESSITPSSASIDKIYYGDFRENPDGKPEYNFYIKDACYTYEEATQEFATEITNMTQFEKDKYYYSSDNNYYLETNDYTYGKNYFNINTTEVLNLIDSYESGKYYYLYDNNYLLENGDNPDETKTYYEINPDLMDDVTDPENHKLFFRGRDQITDENGINKGYCYLDEYGVYRPLSQNSIFNDTYNYYWAEGYEIKRVPSQEEPGNPEKDNVSLIIDKDTDIKYQVIFVEFNESKNYYSIDENNNYIKLLKENIDDNVVYKIFEQDAVKPIEGLFYEPNLYHYSANGIDYIFGIEPNKIDGVSYYKLNSEEMKVTFYEPNKYYYIDDNGNYVIDMNSTKGDYEYYNYYPLYVIPDKSNSTIFPDGSLWNPNLSTEIATKNNVVLGTRKEAWRWKKLIGFARNLNTIHGLIVKINNILKIDDTETRDRNTVQGCINSMNDIMNRIDVLKPSCSLMTDEYGRIISTNSANTDAKLDQLEINTGDNADINSEDTLGSALSKLQVQIHEEESARATSINDLNSSVSSQFEACYSKIEEEDNAIKESINKQVEDIYSKIEEEDNAVKETISQQVEDIYSKIEEEGANSTATTERIDSEIDAIETRVLSLEQSAVNWTAAADKHAEYDGTLNNLNSRMEQLEDSTDDLTENYQNLLSDFTDLENQYSEAQSLITDYGARIANLENQINSLQNSIASLMSRVSELEKVPETPEEPEIPEEPETPETPEEV